MASPPGSPQPLASVGVFTLLWDVAHVVVVSMLGRRRPIGRVLPLSPPIVNLLVLPFGTALGAYAFWIRLTEESRL